MGSRSHRRSGPERPAPSGAPAAAPAAPGDAASRDRPTALHLLLVVLLAGAVHAGTLANGFVNDDEHQVLLNPWITEPGHLLDILTGSAWGFLHSVRLTDYYRPVMHLVYLATQRAFGLEAWGFHLVNVLLHAANTALVLLLASGLLRRSSGPSRAAGAAAADGARTPAPETLVPLFAALLFATHPAHVEAVAWVASVPDLSFTFFGLLGLWLYLPGERAPLRSLSATLPLFVLALLSKETAIVLPALLVVCDLALDRVPRGARAAALRYGPYALVAGAYLAVRHQVLARVQIAATIAPDLEAASLPLTAARLFADYLGILLLPVRLTFWHPFRPVASLASLDALVGIGAVTLFAGACVWAGRRHRLTFVALAMIAIPLLPAFYIRALPGRPFAERYLYAPSVGFCLLAALASARLAAGPRARRAALALVLVVTALYSLATVRRIRVWRDSFTLWADTVRSFPQAPVPPLDLVHSLLQRGRPVEAAALLRILVTTEPGNAAFRSALGSALLVAGRTEEGIVELRSALALDPRSLETHNDLAIALRRQGRLDEALDLYRRALDLDPGFADAHFNLAGALADAGRGKEALEHYREAVRLRPDNAFYRGVLGIECARQGLLDEAITQFREAARLAPAEAAWRNNLERALALRARSVGPLSPSP